MDQALRGDHYPLSRRLKVLARERLHHSDRVDMPSEPSIIASHTKGHRRTRSVHDTDLTLLIRAGKYSDPVSSRASRDDVASVTSAGREESVEHTVKPSRDDATTTQVVDALPLTPITPLTLTTYTTWQLYDDILAGHLRAYVDPARQVSQAKCLDFARKAYGTTRPRPSPDTIRQAVANKFGVSACFVHRSALRKLADEM